jgi:endonuclease YncB( thermonuclease family)
VRNQRIPFKLAVLLAIAWGIVVFAGSLVWSRVVMAAPIIDQGRTVQVARIHDGDTFADRAGQSYRLHGVDSPELCQPWGPRARLQLADILARGEVWVWAWGGRSWKREVVDAMVMMPHGLSIDVAAEMVRRGVAHVDDRYVSGPRERALLAIEEGARLRQDGLWRYPPTIRPRDWRAEHRGVRPPRCGQ